MSDDFITKKPSNHFLSTLVDYYFYIDIKTDKLKLSEEYIIPFPRITFGYFFDYPFLVTNHDLNKSVKPEMAVSRISMNKITVQPTTNTIKIIGAHVKPYTLAYFTKRRVSDLPWVIKPEELFKEKAISFKDKINQCNSPEKMFAEVEKFFLQNLLIRDLKIISRAVDTIEEYSGEIKLNELAEKLNTSERTLRNQFYNHVGCSPKEYSQLVKLRKTIYQMRFSKDSLTKVTYDNNYFDQAHLSSTINRITGKSPKQLKSELPSFRFLQF